MQKFSETDIILNADGSIYHLNLLPGDIADTVITVGDPDRVGEVSRYFDNIELKKGKREFITHTGNIGSKWLTVISTGIGTDNIDIVLNELDALVNIDLETRLIKNELKALNIIRIGTSGAIQEDVPVDTLLVSSGAFGLDVLMQYYQQPLVSEELQLITAFQSALPFNDSFKPYYAPASTKLLNAVSTGFNQGITVTSPGFYAPQGRQVRAHTSLYGIMDAIQKFNYKGQRITNIEMETAGLYGLASVLGHHAISFNVILANRATNVFSKDPASIMLHNIKMILQLLADL